MTELQENTTYAMGDLPAWQSQKRHSLFEFVLYAVMICFVVIPMPQTDFFYIIERGVQAIEVLFFVYLSITNLRQKQFFSNNRFHVVVHFYWISYVILAVLFSQTFSLRPFFNYLQICIFLLIAKLYWRKNFVVSMHLLAIILSFLVYLNTVFYILFPDGLWVDTSLDTNADLRRYLFGNYNATGGVVLLALLTQGIYTLTTSRGKLNMYMLFLVGIATILHMGSMTSTVGLSILAFYFIFRRIVKHPYLWVMLFFVVYIAFFILVIWRGNSIEQIPIATYFIEEILGKNTTFTTRTDIWYNCVRLIIDSPWIGYGPQDVEWMNQHIGEIAPHNLWLNILLQGGILLCIPFLCLVTFAFRTSLNQHTSASQFATVVLAVLMLLSLFEAQNSAKLILVFIFLLIVYSTRYIHSTC